jgi:hypothetical protein
MILHLPCTWTQGSLGERRDGQCLVGAAQCPGQKQIQFSASGLVGTIIPKVGTCSTYLDEGAALSFAVTGLTQPLTGMETFHERRHMTKNTPPAMRRNLIQVVAQAGCK